MTKIEWAHAGLGRGETWNPIRARNKATGNTGWYCEKVSPACDNCYAERLNKKPGATGGTGLPYKPGHRGDVEIYLDEKTSLAPIKWRAPRGIFVCSMTDLFADFVPDEWIDHIFAVAALCPQHRFLCLTKRPKRMQEFVDRLVGLANAAIKFDGTVLFDEFPHVTTSIAHPQGIREWPLPNVWLGVTAEDQRRADERVPDLLATPAAVRFVSIEPILGAVDLRRIEIVPTSLNARGNIKRSGIRVDALTGKSVESGLSYHSDWNGEGAPPTTPPPRLDWAICGGESGSGARPMHPDWARALRDQCAAAGVPFFFKQRGEWSWSENPMVEGSDAYETTRNNDHPQDWRERDCGVICMRRDGSLCDGLGAHDGSEFLYRIGKRRAGRLLDGAQYSEFPL